MIQVNHLAEKKTSLSMAVKPLFYARPALCISDNSVFYFL